MYQEEAICNREIYKNAEINVLKLEDSKIIHFTFLAIKVCRHTLKQAVKILQFFFFFYFSNSVMYVNCSIDSSPLSLSPPYSPSFWSFPSVLMTVNVFSQRGKQKIKECFLSGGWLSNSQACSVFLLHIKLMYRKF
jgi:hypothetical protein